MATIDIFFGQETVMGEPKDSNKTNPKQICDKLFLNPIQSWRGALGWDLSSFSPLLADSSVSVLASALYHSSRSLFHQFFIAFSYAFFQSRMTFSDTQLRWSTGEWYGCAETLEADSRSNQCNSKKSNAKESIHKFKTQNVFEREQHQQKIFWMYYNCTMIINWDQSGHV